MRAWILEPSNWVWCVLMLLSCVSFTRGASFGDWGGGCFSFSVLPLMLITFLKVWMVIHYFMEVRFAPLPLRILCNAWMVICCGGIVLVRGGLECLNGSSVGT